MHGKPDNGLKNYLREAWSLSERVERGDVIASLMEHPGWALLEEIVGDAYSRGLDNLVHGGLKEQAEYAERLGVHNGMRFFADAAASVLASAGSAREQLAKRAERDAAAERS
jgi:hypothetical protein